MPAGSNLPAFLIGFFGFNLFYSISLFAIFALIISAILPDHEKTKIKIQIKKGIKKEIEEFGTYHGIKIGYKGKFDEEKNFADFVKDIKKNINKKCKILNFGRKKIKSVGVVSGGAASLIDEAIEEVDCFVTGEPS
ncbi:MAG: Nif3-like dinuclear metal center hexameric protein, partial [Runella zeae]